MYRHTYNIMRSARAPTPIEPGGYLCSFPHHLNPPISGKGYPSDIPPYLGYVCVPLCNYKKKHPVSCVFLVKICPETRAKIYPLFLVFSGNLPDWDYIRAKNTPFPEKMWNAHRSPYMHSSWGARGEAMCVCVYVRVKVCIMTIFKS